MSSNSVFSIIVAVFNGAENLQRCIDSVISQNYPHKELIIIDGKSTDNTINIIKTNEHKIAYWESEVDRGIYHAFNKALLHITGDWIIFLGCDDYLWNSDVLANVTQKLVLLNSGICLFYGKVAMVSQRNEILQIVNQPWKRAQHNFYQFYNIHHQGVFHHRSLFSRNGLFDESFKIAGDYELLLRELKTQDAQFLEDIIVSGMQLGGMSTLPNNYLKVYREFYKARKKNGVSTLQIGLGWLYLKACIRVFIKWIFGDKYSRLFADLYRQMTGRSPVWTRL